MKRLLDILALALMVLGVLVSNWMFAAVGLVLAAVLGRWFMALFFGMLLDVMYGAPYGRFQALHVPFTIIAIFLICVRISFSRYFMERGRGAYL